MKEAINRFEICNGVVTIYRKNAANTWDIIGKTDFNEKYYKELSSHTWRLQNGYPYNKSLGGGLHRYVMGKWYGESVVKDFTKNGYVIDHINNIHTDCRICNLEFLQHDYNVAKGLSLDKDIEKMKKRIALSIFKDFSTGFFQITIGCNDDVGYIDKLGQEHHLTAVKLLYKLDYSLVLLDAQKILSYYRNGYGIDLNQLSFCQKKMEESPNFVLSNEEKGKPIIFRNGEPYLVLSNNTTIDSIFYEEGWGKEERK